MDLPSIFFGDLSVRHVEAYLRESKDKRIIVPTGSTEQHGRHSPHCTDALIATEVSVRVARRLDAIVAPTVSYGLSAGHRGMSVAYVRNETFLSMIQDICWSLAESGFRNINFINGHWSNNHPANMACAAVQDRLPPGTRAYAITYWDALTPEELEDYLSMRVGMHANIGETSVVMAINKKLVELAHAETAVVFPPTSIQSNPQAALFGFVDIAHQSMPRATNWTGVWGDPRESTVERGRRYLEQIERAVAELIRDIDATWDHFSNQR